MRKEIEGKSFKKISGWRKVLLRKVIDEKNGMVTYQDEQGVKCVCRRTSFLAWIKYAEELKKEIPTIKEKIFGLNKCPYCESEKGVWKLTRFSVICVQCKRYYSRPNQKLLMIYYRITKGWLGISCTSSTTSPTPVANVIRSADEQKLNNFRRNIEKVLEENQSHIRCMRMGTLLPWWQE